MNKPGRSKLGTAVALALSCVLPAGVLTSPRTLAQTAPQDRTVELDEDEDEIVVLDTIEVTGTLIDRPGFEAPTPTTVIDEVELRQAGRNNAAEVLADIPQFRFSNNPSGNAGFNTVGSASGDLRALGFARTLNLLNGRRFIGDFDLNSVPFAAIKRIDVVTGGASATYGSGAVAGVINILLNDEMNGVEVGAQTGLSTRGDGEQYRFDITGGTDFADGRGNVLLAAEYFEDKGILSRNARENVGGFGVLSNPTFIPDDPATPLVNESNGQQPSLLVPDVGFSVFSRGGLALSGPFAGQQFLPGGALAPFNRGTIVSGAFGSGGDGPQIDETFALKAPLERRNALAAMSYDLTDTIRLSADFRYANVKSGNDLLPDFQGQATTGILGFPLGPTALGGVGAVSIDNPFLPAAARAQLIAAGQSFFVFGRYNNDFGNIRSDVERETYQGSIALDGSLGETFRWSAYYTHGEQRRDEAFSNFVNGANFALASDVVTSPTTGQPICRVQLTSPSTPCVPINLFGEGAPSAAALDFVLGTSSLVAKDKLDVVAATLRGEPFSLWAGPVSIAVGAEYRKESSRGTVDALSAAKAFPFFNFVGFGPDGFSVKEAFGEILVPLVKDVPLLRNLEFNGAARYSDYSTSGGIWAWKLGLTDELFDGLRVRAVRSRDVRAPGIGELFGAGGAITQTIRNPFRTPNTTDVVVVRTGPNPDLVPEEADTTTAGVVFEPSFIPGLSLAADYYSIDISGAITSLSGQSLVNLCFDNPASPACGTITFDQNGAITQVRATLLNIATFKTSGVDLEMSYRMPLDKLFASAPGRINFRVLASYVDELIFDDGVIRNDSAGLRTGVPHWRGIASATYEDESFSTDLRARYVGSTSFPTERNQGISCDPIGRTTLCPDVKAAVYVDLSMRFNVPLGNDDADRLTIYGGVVNLFDRDPPRVPNFAFYDLVGRYFTVGVRANF